MQQLGDIPRFQGSESPQEAEQWLDTLIISTGNFTNSGIFRLITARLPSGSLARKWFDELEEPSKDTWIAFEEQFRSRWIMESQHLAQLEAAWDAFTHHRLTSNAIFREEVNNCMSVNDRISGWAEDHLRLGAATKRDDSALIDTTKLLLPPFIQAYLQVYLESPSSSFDDYCQAIISLPPDEVELEQIRRQISSGDLISAMERKIEEISEQVKRLVATIDQRIIQVPGAVPATILSNESSGALLSDESIAWEPCSPVTSTMSVVAPASNAISGQSTPIAQSVALLEGISFDRSNNTSNEATEDSTTGDDINKEDQNSSFCTPVTWRKSMTSMTRKEWINTTQQAIEFLLGFGSDLRPGQAYSLQSSIMVLDKISNCSNSQLVSVPNNGSSDELYGDLYLGILGIHFYTIYQAHSRIGVATRTWERIVGTRLDNRSTDNIVMPDQTNVHIPMDNTYSLYVKQPGDQTMAGSLFVPGSRYISSIRTILFMTFGGYLAECTSEVRQKEIAILSANCVKNWMLDSGTSLVKDCCIDVKTAKEQAGAALSCHLTGVVIEGFCVLASVTQDDSWNSLAIDVAKAAMLYDGWHKSDGVLHLDETLSKNTDIRAYKGLLNRGLLIAYQRNRSNKHFCNMVRRYINVQCNALLELSRLRNSYGLEWAGPYTGPYAHAQMAAIDTFVAAIGVNDG